MKLKLLSLALGAAFSVSAMAAPVALPQGPLYFQFTNLEQTALGVDTAGNPLNNTATCAGCSGPEGNWGIAQVSIMRAGTANPVGAVAGQVGNDIDNAGTAPFFSDQLFPTAGGQVTAMFHGAVQTSITTAGTVNTLTSTGGYIDLYWDDPSMANTIVNIGAPGVNLPGGRTSNSTYTGFTDGTFLGRLAFASGISANPTTFIAGTIDTALANQSGSADSYANVADFNGDGLINGADGLWAAQLNSDWFGTVFGTRDIRFSNKIDSNINWNSAPGTGVFGQTSNDPGRGFVPEPASLALVGLGLLGVAASRRRRNS